MNCSLVVRDELAERYVLGQLTPGEQETYERHYFECDRCFGELRSLQALRAALQVVPPAAQAPVRREVRMPWWAWATAGAVAASLVGVVLLQNRAPERIASQESSPAAVTPRAGQDAPAASAPSADSQAEPAAAADATAASAAAQAESEARPDGPSRRSDILARLAQIDPPRYSPRVLRGATDPATASFHTAMKAYKTGDYRGALPELREAANVDPERPDIAFYLASATLLSGDTTGAVREFQRTIGMGETPYLEEAHFQLAKAYLQQGAVAEARSELTWVADLAAERSGEARALLEQLRTLPPE